MLTPDPSLATASLTPDPSLATASLTPDPSLATARLTPGLTPDPFRAFGGLRARDVRSLAGPVVATWIDQGRVLLRAGEPTGTFAVIYVGSVELREGAEIVRRLGPGDCFGEIDPRRPPRQPFTAVTASRVRLLTFGAYGIERYCAAIPGAHERIMAALGRANERSGGGTAAARPQGVLVEHGDRPVVGRDPAELAHQPQRARDRLPGRPRPPRKLVLGQR